MEGHAIVEQMGHRRITGRVSEVEVCGAKMLRVETLSTPPIVTLVHPQSLFAITPCSEERARRASADYHPMRELEAAPADEEPVRDAASESPELPCERCGARADEPCRDDCDAAVSEEGAEILF